MVHHRSETRPNKQRFLRSVPRRILDRLIQKREGRWSGSGLLPDHFVRSSEDKSNAVKTMKTSLRRSAQRFFIARESFFLPAGVITAAARPSLRKPPRFAER